MRLQEIRDRLVKAMIPHPFDYFKGGSVITNLVEFRSRLDAVKDIPGFEQLVMEVRDSVALQRMANEVGVEQAEWSRLSTLSARLNLGLSGLYRYVTSTLADQSEQSVFIKLPKFYEFSAGIEHQHRLEKALSQLVVNPRIVGRVELRGWEKGSFWIEVFLGSMAAVSVVGTAAWAAAVVWKKKHEAAITSEFVSSLKIKNEALSAVKDGIVDHVRLVVELEAKAIADEYYGPDVDREQIERIKYSIKEFSELLSEGAEIHPALQAPENVSNLFPSMGNLLAISSRVKQIPEIAGGAADKANGQA